MKKSATTCHEFALYYEPLSHRLKRGDRLIIDEKELVHRIERVLRLKMDEQFVLFNRAQHAVVRIAQMDRKRVELEVASISQNKLYTPRISFFLPILKRDALASAVYYLVEAGVNDIQLVSTQNLQRTWGGQKERERLERVCIAAAEQAKQFAVPELKDPIPFSELQNYIMPGAHCFYGNPEGASFRDTVPITAPKHIVLTCGPEADFSIEEKEKLKTASFQPMRLTPTILRAETAAFCISSLFRTVFS